MLRYENGFTITLIATYGLWSALIRHNDNYWFECSFKSRDRKKMMEYSDALMGTIGVSRIN